MAYRYLLESGAEDGYLLEDDSGIYLIDKVTRFYLPSTGTADVSPSFSSDWGDTTGAFRRNCDTETIRSAMTSQTITLLSLGLPDFLLGGQYISDPLQEQTITGTVIGQIRCSESAAANDATVAFSIRVISYDGKEIYGTLLALSASDNTAATPPEFATSLTNRQIQDSAENTTLTLTPVGVPSGARLLFEFGARTNATTGTVSLNFGDDAAADLGQNNTDTAANNPFLEFSEEILFSNSGWHNLTQAQGSVWTTPNNILASDDAFTTSVTLNQEQAWSNFGFSPPLRATITGIKIKTEGNGDGAAATDSTVDLFISQDSGTVYSAAKIATLPTAVESIIISGSSIDNWGINYSDSQTDSSFWLKIKNTSNPATKDSPMIDNLRGKMFYLIVGEFHSFFPVWKNMSLYLKNLSGSQTTEQTTGPSAGGVFNPSKLDT